MSSDGRPHVPLITPGLLAQLALMPQAGEEKILQRTKHTLSAQSERKSLIDLATLLIVNQLRFFGRSFEAYHIRSQICCCTWRQFSGVAESARSIMRSRMRAC